MNKIHTMISDISNPGTKTKTRKKEAKESYLLSTVLDGFWSKAIQANVVSKLEWLIVTLAIPLSFYGIKWIINDQFWPKKYPANSLSYQINGNFLCWAGKMTNEALIACVGSVREHQMRLKSMPSIRVKTWGRSGNNHQHLFEKH